MNHISKELKSTARLAGIWYLLLAVSGVLGFLVFHSQVFNADPQVTLTNLIEAEPTARIRLILEFVIIISQALTAIWFYKLFRKINNAAALATGIWGTVNAVIIMISAISMASAIAVASSDHTIEEKVLLIELFNQLISNSWAVGGLFFGLWLIPLGYIISSSQRMPIWLGRILIIGGIGYIVSILLNYAGVTASWLDYLTIPASIGEFWMIGYLLIFGIRPAPEENDL
ncbi:DUF4386 domain-containing protein [Marivirga sp.]|uniref:DUF4386 domain-containing protein n=1 Tax=Marivirga sp. TaxID=2018662 RepID=UPI003DA74D5B